MPSSCYNFFIYMMSARLFELPTLFSVHQQPQQQQQQQRQFPDDNNRGINLFGFQLNRQAAAGPAAPPRWEEVRLPPLWKRFAAEFVDFLFLIVLKITITFMAVDWFDLIDLDR